MYAHMNVYMHAYMCVRRNMLEKKIVLFKLSPLSHKSSFALLAIRNAENVRNLLITMP